MKLHRLAAAVAAICVVSSGAVAAPAAVPAPTPEGPDLAHMTPAFNYFNRPGADLAAHNGDLTGCYEDASKAVTADELVQNGGLFGALLATHAYKGVVAANIENCMLVKGWRVVRVSEEEGASLAAMAPADLSQKLAPWIGADAPHGEVTRVWTNEAARGSVKRFAIRPDHKDDGSLSLDALGKKISWGARPAYQPPKSVKLDPIWPKKPLKPEQFATAPAGSAIVIIGVANGGHNGLALKFMRDGDDPKVFPSTVDHAPDVMFTGIGPIWKRGKNINALAVPPGRWRLAGLSDGLVTLNFCWGAPSFEVKAGEVVYAGSFGIDSEDLGPDLDLAPAAALVGSQPAAAKLRAAAYFNGDVSACGDTGMAALEVTGAPYLPGYVWGGARGKGTAAEAH